jgi:hypothetical protein
VLPKRISRLSATSQNLIWSTGKGLNELDDSKRTQYNECSDEKCEKMLDGLQLQRAEEIDSKCEPCLLRDLLLSWVVKKRQSVSSSMPLSNPLLASFWTTTRTPMRGYNASNPMCCRTYVESFCALRALPMVHHYWKKKKVIDPHVRNSAWNVLFVYVWDTIR